MEKTTLQGRPRPPVSCDRYLLEEHFLGGSILGHSLVSLDPCWRGGQQEGGRYPGLPRERGLLPGPLLFRMCSTTVRPVQGPQMVRPDPALGPSWS